MSDVKLPDEYAKQRAEWIVVHMPDEDEARMIAFVAAEVQDIIADAAREARAKAFEEAGLVCREKMDCIAPALSLPGIVGTDASARLSLAADLAARFEAEAAEARVKEMP